MRVLLRSLRKFQWNTDEFWETVDLLSKKQRETLVLSVGGSSRVTEKYKFKVHNAHYNYGLTVGLSRMDYAALLYAANIDATMVSLDGYHLARWMDSGNYERKNCRFLTTQENTAEKILSDKAIESARENGRTVGKNNLLSAVEDRRRLRKEDPKAYAVKEALRTSKSTETKRANLARDPNFYRGRESYKRVGQLTGARVTALRIKRDQDFLSKRISKKKLSEIDYPNFGWKSRFMSVLGLGRGFACAFLNRHPKFPDDNLR